jgi:transposase-like protein
MDKAEHNVLAYMSFPNEHRTKLHSTDEIDKTSLLRGVRIKYLNNMVEQDHRTIKRRIRPMLGFKSFASAASTLAGIRVGEHDPQGPVHARRLPVPTVR